MQFIVPLILIIISGGIFFSWIDPMWQGIKEKQSEQQKFAEIEAKSFQIRQTREDIQQLYNAIEVSDLNRLEKMLPGHIDNIRLILDVNNIATRRGMTIRDIRISGSETGGGGRGDQEIAVTNEGKYSAVDFNFSVVTTYVNFKGFLTDLSKSLRIIDVHNVTISEIQQDEDFYRFGVGITTYWLNKE